MTDFTRRTVVTGAAAATAATAIATVPVSAQTDDDANDFLAVSEVLTGVKKGSLAPRVDPIKINLTYFHQAQSDPDFQAAFQQLLKAYRDNKDKKPQEIADILLNGSGPDIRYLARNIIVAWYLGAWCKKKDLNTYDRKPLAGSPVALPRDQMVPAVISAPAYTQGWAWRVAQAHPMGYSDLRFGYWADPPKPEKPDFLIDS